MKTRHGTKRWAFTLLLLVAVTASFLTIHAIGPLTPRAEAQLFKRDKDRPGIMRRIFRRKEKPAQEEKPVRARSARQTSAKIKTVAVLKNTNAKKILIAGDFLACSLAKGLKVAFADEGSVVIVAKTQPSSGLVRDEVFDWPNGLRREIATDEYAAVVLLVGTNDRQGFRSTEARIALTSEDWIAEYTRRTTAISEILSSANVRPIWVSVPPVRPKKLNAHGINVSTVFRQQSARKNIVFVDLFDAFTDEAGTFVTHGPDIDGQTKKLRTNDGVNFTRAGRRKLAFYVEQQLRRYLFDGVNILASAGDLTSAIGIDEDVSIGPTLSLNSNADFARDALAGDQPLVEYTNVFSPEYRRLVAGLSLPLKPGRVDDFRLTRSGVSELQTPIVPAQKSARSKEFVARTDVSVN